MGGIPHSCRWTVRTLLFLAISAWLLPAAAGQSTGAAPAKPPAGPIIPFAKLVIPRLEQGPKLADYLEMKPSPAFEGKLLKVEGLLQRDPKDGAPVSQKTEIYLGYTRSLALDPNANILRTRGGYINDGRQFFVKLSYLFRY